MKNKNQIEAVGMIVRSKKKYALIPFSAEVVKIIYQDNETKKLMACNLK